MIELLYSLQKQQIISVKARFKDVLMGFPKSDLLDVTMAVIHVAGQRFCLSYFHKFYIVVDQR